MISVRLLSDVLVSLNLVDLVFLLVIQKEEFAINRFLHYIRV